MIYTVYAINDHDGGWKAIERKYSNLHDATKYANFCDACDYTMIEIGAEDENGNEIFIEWR